MKLFLMRHGHAESYPTSNGERTLTNEGIVEVTRMANYLAKQQLMISHIQHSEILRATQTADILANAIATPDTLINEVSTLLNPDKPTNPLLDEINTWNDNTMLVGHMPCLSILVSKLILGNEDPVIRFSPATVVCLQRSNGQQWLLTWVLKPELIS